MRVVTTFENAGRLRHLVVDAPPGTTVTEVHRHLMPGRVSAEDESRRPCWTTPEEARPVVAEAQLLDGAMLGEQRASSGRHSDQAPPDPSVPWVVVATGPDAGGAAPLPPGRWVVAGRDSSCDLTIDDPGLSRRHLRLRQERHQVRVEDLASTNGLGWEQGGESARWRTGDRLLVGSSSLELLPRRPAPTHLAVRDGVLCVTPWRREVPQITPAELSTQAPGPRRVVRAPSAWTWSLPLAVALVVAAVLRMPWLLLFGLLGPAMVFGHYLGDRRSARLEHEEAQEAYRSALAANSSLAEQRLQQELARLRRRDPGVVGVVSALVPFPSVALWQCAAEEPTVTLGEHESPSSVQLEGAALEHARAPLVLSLEQPLVLVGPARTEGVCDGLMRALLLQLAARHPPEQWSLVVDLDAPPGPGWDLLAWLPHTRGRPGHAGVESRWGADLMVVDHPSKAPADHTRILVTGPDRAVLQRPGHADVSFRPTCLSLARARHLARALAPLRSTGIPGADGPTTAGPQAPSRSLGDLGAWPSSPDEALGLWRRPSMAVPLGTDGAGRAVLLDLGHDGPHALVAGTTGSGKSELLRALVLGLAMRSSPADLALLLVDFKGGAALADCAGLPHVSGLVTDLDPHLAERVLRSLQAELARRERVLADHGARDASDVPTLPRLVVVVDEFRVLADEVPEVMAGLIRVAAVGRSLGVHLVLATQRPAGVVGADLRANVNLRIALRVRDVADSVDVIESPLAAQVPEGRPGLGWWRTGADAPRPVQVARVAPPTARAGGVSITTCDDVWTARRLRDTTPGALTEGSITPLVETLVQAARHEHLSPPVVWQPPLPTRVENCPHDPRAWALADRPDQQCHEPVVWRGSGTLAVVGSARSGRSTALRSVLSREPGAWLVVFDLGRALARTELQTRAGVCAWVEPDDLAHGARVLELVLETVLTRQRQAESTRRLILAIDGWDRFVDLFADRERGRLLDIAHRILREGPSVGVTTVVTGDRSLLLGRVASLLAEIWALRLHDPADLLMSGLHPRQIPRVQPPGRVLRVSDGVEAQVILPTALASPGPEGPAPLVCRPLPRTWRPPQEPGTVGAWAVGGDAAEPLARPPSPTLVLGPPGSGRTTALQALLGDRAGVVVEGRDPPPAADLDRLLGQLGPGGLLLVDDAELLGADVEDRLLAAARSSGAGLVVAADTETAARTFHGLIPEAGRTRTALILQPGAAGDGAVVGTSVPVGDVPVPGRGVLVHRGRCTRVQVAADSPAAAAVPTRGEPTGDAASPPGAP